MRRIILRIFFVIALVTLPTLLSWWLFFPLCILFVYKAKRPLEAIFGGFLLDNVYSFDGNFLEMHLLAIFALALVLLATLLETQVNWRKIV